VILQGACRVGEHAEIGPNCHLVDTVVGDAAVVSSTVARRAEIGPGAIVGPFVTLVPGEVVPPGAKVSPGHPGGHGSTGWDGGIPAR